MKENLLKNSYVSAFETTDDVIRDLIIINTKSLVDDKEEHRVYIDENRLKAELKYYNYYGNRIVESNLLGTLLPVALSNKDVSKAVQESIDLITKLVSYFKINEKLYDYILASVTYVTMVSKILGNKDIEYGELLQKMKESVIELELDVTRKDVVKFQMSRISLIKLIDDYIDLRVSEYADGIMQGLLDVVYDVYIEDRTTVEDGEYHSGNTMRDEGLNSIKKSILSLLGEEPNRESIDNYNFLDNMSDYVYKLRNYSIAMKPFCKDVDPRYIISLNVGDSAQDPVLNKLKVLTKVLTDNILSVEITCKSGTYVLKFRKTT
ncbi:MAG: hypothetical protein LBN09_05145 [Clostridioides sp.]|jgi:hypothetical protein|nr:hypothetical protein [Clostridioides sp.]